MDELKLHFYQLIDIANAMETLDEEYLNEIDINLLQKELKVLKNLNICLNNFLFR